MEISSQSILKVSQPITWKRESSENCEENEGAVPRTGEQEIWRLDDSNLTIVLTYNIYVFVFTSFTNFTIDGIILRDCTYLNILFWLNLKSVVKTLEYPGKIYLFLYTRRSWSESAILNRSQ
ncbi:unnamed protein product [Callosobruchus maculatus]|uniref:Uncharacterized protein n=1 Tax=Callosobruchus maculatus TaxID=64391 RepID=A0A653DMH3_CALMS|nr:unnamed protein product [Callosobruchus maculatus]